MDIISIIQERQEAQKQRIRYANKIKAVELGRDQVTDMYFDFLQRQFQRYKELEDALNKDLNNLLTQIHHPIIDYMTTVKYVGRIMASQLYSYIDIHKAHTISALWRYCGYAVREDGTAEKPRKGEKLHSNPAVTPICYNIGVNIIRKESPYRKIYIKAREKYEDYDWTKKHKYLAALRKPIKLFLAHLWMVWRALEDLPLRTTFVIEYRNHHQLILPHEYGWEIPENIVTKLELLKNQKEVL